MSFAAGRVLSSAMKAKEELPRVGINPDDGSIPSDPKGGTLWTSYKN